jgi:hypothetical protein
VEKPVVAPQSRWNITASRRPSGEGIRDTMVFPHVSEHPMDRRQRTRGGATLNTSHASEDPPRMKGSFQERAALDLWPTCRRELPLAELA